MKNHALFREGLPTLGILTFITVILFFIQPWLAFLGIGFILFIIYFFRDPKREIPKEESVILAPADGTIISIDEVQENKFMKQKTVCISIFMSPLDVHINRSPISGAVDYIEYEKGKFISATKPESHQENEKNYIGIANNKIKVLVVQIAGIMARRIVNWTKMNESLQKGSKIGMIKFSSGTQIYLPIQTDITVNKGDKIISGLTIIGRYR